MAGSLRGNSPSWRIVAPSFGLTAKSLVRSHFLSHWSTGGSAGLVGVTLHMDPTPTFPSFEIGYPGDLTWVHGPQTSQAISLLVGMGGDKSRKLRGHGWQWVASPMRVRIAHTLISPSLENHSVPGNVEHHMTGTRPTQRWWVTYIPYPRMASWLSEILLDAQQTARERGSWNLNVT